MFLFQLCLLLFLFEIFAAFLNLPQPNCECCHLMDLPVNILDTVADKKNEILFHHISFSWIAQVQFI